MFSERLASPELADSLAGDLGHPHRGARPGRGPQRRDRRPGLPVPDEAQPQHSAGGEPVPVSQTSRAGSATAPSSSAAARSCVASTSPSAPARWWRCSAPTAPASRRWCAPCSGSSRPRRGEVRAVRHPARRVPRLAAGRLRAAAGERGVRRARLGPRGGRVRSALTTPAVPAPASRADREAVEAAIEAVGLADQARDGVVHAVGRPAAARADRPGVRRGARPSRARRADRRGRRTQPAGVRRRAAHHRRPRRDRSCSSPTSSARSGLSWTARW